jgi:hypothetical protein
MPIIWCAISGHGYGHAAQMAPVLNELGRRIPDLTAILRTTVPASFFHDRLAVSWDLRSVQQDVGCIQNGPLDIDVPRTWEALLQFHAGLESRISLEAADMRAAAPRMVLADTAYLASAAAARAGIPSIVLASFTWNDVLHSFPGAGLPPHQAVIASMQQAYGDAHLGLRIAPGLPLAGVRDVQDIGPIAEPAQSKREELRALLQCRAEERLVLVGFGGIPLEALPWEEMATLRGYHFLIDGITAQVSPLIHPVSELPFSFKTVLASVDVIMTKPGYGTIVEAVTLGIPVVYVRRYNFADELPLVDFLHQFGRGRELDRHDFFSGNWRPALDAVRHAKEALSPPAVTGARDAAQVLAKYFE